MAIDANKMTFGIIRPPGNDAGASTRSKRRTPKQFSFRVPMLSLWGTLFSVLVPRFRGNTAAATKAAPVPPPHHLAFVAGLPPRSTAMTFRIVAAGCGAISTAPVSVVFNGKKDRDTNSRGATRFTPAVRVGVLQMTNSPGSDKEDEKMELAAEVVGAVTKATVGFAVDRAAETVSEEQGMPSRDGRPPSQQMAAGAKRKALAGLVSNFVAFVKADDDPMVARIDQQVWDVRGRSPPSRTYGSSGRINGRGGGAQHLKSSAASPPSSSMTLYNKETVGGVMVNGYWFPSLAAAAEAPAGKGFDFEQAAAQAAAVAARAEERRRLKASRRRAAEAARPRGIDFTCGAVLLSSPAQCDESEDIDVSEKGDVEVLEAVPEEMGMQRNRQEQLPLWRRWTVSVMQRTGLMARAEQAIRDSVPRMPREALMMVAGVAGAELAKREIAAQVEALEEPVRAPAWALLNETYKNVEARTIELAASGWDFEALVTKELADWKRRGVGNSYQEVLLKEVIELQTRSLLLRPDEGSLLIQLNATYRSIEESIGRLLPQQTKEQLSLLEGLVRKLDDKGIGELSFDEVYRALLLGAVPPALVTDAVRLLAAGKPGEGGGAGLISGEATQAYSGRDGGGDVTLASLAARLNDTQEISRVMRYTALAAETEVIENLREVLEGLQGNIRKSLVDIETELKQPPPPPPSVLQGAVSYAHSAARSTVAFAIDGFNNASRIFDASFEALAEPSRRTLLRSSELFPWQSWYQAWTNITKGEDNLFATAEHTRLSAAAAAAAAAADARQSLFGDKRSNATHSDRAALAQGDLSSGSGGGYMAGVGASVADMDEGPRWWLKPRGAKRWRPDSLPDLPPDPPRDEDGASSNTRDFPASLGFGRKRWKGS